MFEIIPTLLTPAMLAMSPLQTEAPTIKYDWTTQSATAFDKDGKEMQLGKPTWRSSDSFTLRGLMQDDWNQD